MIQRIVPTEQVHPDFKLLWTFKLKQFVIMNIKNSLDYSTSPDDSYKDSEVRYVLVFFLDVNLGEKGHIIFAHFERDHTNSVAR